MAEVHYTPLDKGSKQFSNEPLPGCPQFYKESAKSSTECRGEVTVPKDVEGRLMAPIETTTGVPLPIVGREVGSYSNRHHSFYYADFYREGGLALRATRYSRLQRVHKLDHVRYHQLYEGGTVVPQDDKLKFRLTVLSFAGYVPRFGVDTQRETITELSPRQRSQLREPGIFTIAGEEKDKLELPSQIIGQFLMGYAINQNFDHVKTALIEEFLSLSEDMCNEDEGLRMRKFKLAMRLTNIAIGTAVDPLRRTYEEARKAHLFGIRNYPGLSPVSAFEEVKRFVNGHEPDYFEVLERRLAQQYQGAVAA